MVVHRTNWRESHEAGFFPACFRLVRTLQTEFIRRRSKWTAGRADRKQPRLTKEGIGCRSETSSRSAPSGEESRARRWQHAVGRRKERLRRFLREGHERKGREGAPTSARERTWRRTDPRGGGLRRRLNTVASGTGT